MAFTPIALHGQGFYGTHDIHIPPKFTEPGVAFSKDVVVNGRFVHRFMDRSDLHTIPPPLPPTKHPEFITSGIRLDILVNGKPVAQLGATCTTGCPVVLASVTVLMGGGIPSPEAIEAAAEASSSGSRSASGGGTRDFPLADWANAMEWYSSGLG